MRFLVFLMIFFSWSLAAFASPDVDFPRPGQSYGGKVRGGPGMQYRQVGSLREGDRIVVLGATGVQMNGYEWFEIQYGNGRRGFQWGGLMCTHQHYPGIYQVCQNRRTQVDNTPYNPPVTPPPVTNPPPRQAGRVDGYSVARVDHAGGSFINTGAGQWQEADQSGQVNFYFREQGRDEWSVYLHDASRNVSLQLDLHRQMVLYGLGNQPKTNLYNITGAFAQGGNRQSGGGGQQPSTANVVHYTCPEGLPLAVIYVNSGNGHALVAYDSPQYTRLEQVVSGSGTRYSNGTVTLHSKGNGAMIETPSGLDRCQQN